MKRKDYQKPLTEVVALDFDEVMCLPGASQIDNDGDGNRVSPKTQLQTYFS